jgi:hypothetical protein
MNKLHKKLEQLIRNQKTYTETAEDGTTELSIWTESTKIENEIVKLLDTNNIDYLIVPCYMGKKEVFFNLIIEDLYK